MTEESLSDELALTKLELEFLDASILADEDAKRRQDAQRLRAAAVKAKLEKRSPGEIAALLRESFKLEPRADSASIRALLHELSATPVDSCINLGSGVACIDVARRSELVVVGTNDGRVSVWSSSDARHVTDLRSPSVLGRSHVVGKKQHAMTATFSPNERSIIAGGRFSKSACVWRLDEESSLELEGHFAGICSATWLSDSRVVTGSFDRSARVWNTREGCVSAVLGYPGPMDGVSRSPQFGAWHNAPVDHIGVSPDGTRIATAAPDGRVLLWDADETKQEVAWIPPGTRAEYVSLALRAELNPHLFEQHSGGTSSQGGPHVDWFRGSRRPLCAFSDDGRFIATAGHGDESMGTATAMGPLAREVHLWDGRTGDHLNALTGHLAKVTSLHYFESGLLASGSEDGMCLISHPEAGEYAFVLVGGHTGGVISGTTEGGGIADICTLAGEQIVVTAGSDGRLCLWSIHNRSAIAASAQGASYTRSYRGIRRSFVSPALVIEGLGHLVRCTPVSDTSFVTASLDGQVRFWDLPPCFMTDPEGEPAHAVTPESGDMRAIFADLWRRSARTNWHISRSAARALPVVR